MGNRPAPEGAPRNPEPGEEGAYPRGAELWDEDLRGVPRPGENPGCGLEDPVLRPKPIGDAPPIGPKVFKNFARFVPK